MQKYILSLTAHSRTLSSIRSCRVSIYDRSLLHSYHYYTVICSCLFLYHNKCYYYTCGGERKDSLTQHLFPTEFRTKITIFSFFLLPVKMCTNKYQKTVQLSLVIDLCNVFFFFSQKTNSGKSFNCQICRFVCVVIVKI